MSDNIGKTDIIDSLPVGVLAVDADMRIIRFNREIARQLNAYSSSPLSVGAEFSRLIPDEKIVMMLVETISGKTASMYGYRIESSHSGNEDRFFDLIAAPIEDINLKSHGAVLVTIDATPRQQYLRGIKSSKEEAEFYVDLMSHDIRNFNQITMGYIELLLLSEKLSPDETAYLEKAQKGVTGSNRLIDNIKKIRMIRQSAGKELKRTELGEVLKQDAETVQKASPAAKITLSESIGKEKRYVMANDFIHEIFRHIMENAVKYDPHEQKLIEADASETIEDGRAYWVVRIADHGSGVPDDRKQSIFERMTKTTKGAGIGLSIVSVIVSKYGGHIRVEDRVKGDPSKGSVFIVELPRA